MRKIYLGNIFVKCKLKLPQKNPLAVAPLLLFSLVSVGFMAEAEAGKLLDYVNSENYTALNTEIGGLIKSYEADFLKESDLEIALDEVSTSDPALEEKLTKWVIATPDSVAAHLVRGSYYNNVGWMKRGVKFYDQTTKQQIDGMQYYFRKAYADLEKAKSLDENLVHARIIEMDLLKSYGEHERIKALRDEALKINPYSFTVRRYYIASVTPRWGGSMAEIENEIKTARPYYDKNPRLKTLEGELYKELGDQAISARQYKQAIDYFSTALEYQANGYNYNRRGYAFHLTGDYSSALKDYDKAIELSPFYSNAYGNRGGAKYKTKNYEGAIEDYSKALSSDPDNAELLDFRGYTYLLIGDAQSAHADLERAVALAPNIKRYHEDLESAKKALATGKSN